MMKQQSGFTLIELVMVIVILAALAVTAIPRFVNLQAEADAAALEGVAGALAAGSAINYAACVSGNGACLNAASATPFTNCTDVARTLTSGAVPTGYVITAGALGAIGNTVSCTLTHPNGTDTTTFSAISPG